MSTLFTFTSVILIYTHASPKTHCTLHPTQNTHTFNGTKSDIKFLWKDIVTTSTTQQTNNHCIHNRKMADWLRPVFGRTKSALNITSTPSISSFQLPSDDTRQVEAHTASQTRPASRVATFMGICTSTHGPPIAERNLETQAVPPTGEVRPRWECDKMVEKFKCIMMTINTFDSLPREYNFYILHFLEAYQEMGEKLEMKQRVVDDLRMTRAAELEEFEQLAAQWELKENEYKLEVKRLELMLSRTAGGMENVALARSKSKVHGTQRVAQTFGSELTSIRDRHVAMEEKHYQEAKRQREEDMHTAAFRNKCMYNVFLASCQSVLGQEVKVLLYDGSLCGFVCLQSVCSSYWRHDWLI